MEGQVRALRHSRVFQHTGRPTVGARQHRFPAIRNKRLERTLVTCSGKRFKMQDAEQKGRQAQLHTTEMLAKLLQAPEPGKVAADNVNSLSEEFFTVSSAYLDMARKEGNTDVYTKLETVLKIAMEKKQKTLRPEIQLLNKLLGSDVSHERKQILNTRKSGETLLMNERYFFSLLERMISDVTAQRESPQKAGLLRKLQDIKEECKARAS